MIDTVKLVLLAIYTPNYDLLIAHFLSTLDDYSTIKEQNGEKRYYGNLKNLKVRITQRSITIEGSLLIFIKGNNQLNFSKRELKKAINELSEKFGLPLLEAKVVRLDVAYNIPMIEAGYKYYDVLKQLSKANRHQYKNGLNYDSLAKRSWYLTIYEKMKKVKKDEATELYQGQNIFRPEFRFLNSSLLANLLKVKTATLSDVMEGYEVIMKKWVMVLLSIEKKHEFIGFHPSVFTTRNAFDNQIKLLGVEAMGGIDSVISMIDTAKKSGYFTHPNQPYNLRLRYQDLMKSPSLTVKSGLAEEFDRKVRLMAVFVEMEATEDAFLEGEARQA
jgi:hypothetical protein